MKRLTALVLSLVLTSGAAGASADAGLANDKEIANGLLAMAVADKIRRSCNGISGRFFRARNFARDLQNFAQARGYTQAEIEAFLDDPVQRMNMLTLRNAYFESKGIGDPDAEDLCGLGRAEIAEKTMIGNLLKAK